MRLGPDLVHFMRSPVMIILGTHDRDLCPEIGRAAGAVVEPEEGRADLVVSGWQWPETVANVRENGHLCATFARPSDYVCYQIKGRADVISATPAHLEVSARYLAATGAALLELGLDRPLSAPWLVGRDPVVLRLSIEQVFVQTPGEGAGRLMDAQG